MKKLNWLDKFAEEQAQKMNKVASMAKVAEQVIVSPEDVPNAQEGSTIEFNGEQFTVVNANFSDEMGPGVVLEKAAAYEGLEKDPMGMSMGVPASSVSTPSSQGQQYHYDLNNNTQQTYDNDQDAAWGQSSAPATEQMIAGENAIDRTTVPGKYTNSPGLNNAAPAAPIATDVTDAVEVTDVPAPTPEAAPAEEVTNDEVHVEETQTEEVPATKEEVVEENQVEEEDKKVASSNRILNRIYQKGNK